MKLKFNLIFPLLLIAAAAFTTPAHAQTSSTLVPGYKAGRNYIGVGGSNDGAVVNGKYAFSNNFSIRPEVFTNARNDNGARGAAVLAPITYDFRDPNRPNQALVPFVGAGPGITTGDSSTNVQLVTTAGADYKIGKRYTADASVNYLPFDDSRADFVAGVGYNF